MQISTKLIFLFFCLALSMQAAKAQFYYNDIVLTRQAREKWKIYQQAKVKSVNIMSMDAANEPAEGFTCEQQTGPDYAEITTHTKSSLTSESWSFAHYDAAGFLRSNLDTSANFQSNTAYTYDDRGLLVSLTNTALSTNTDLKDVELHQWVYDPKGNARSMLKVKNGHDSTLVEFVREDNGQIAEEHATRNGQKLPVIYYYYDSAGQLTDIVRYNEKARRLLPDNIFEYDVHGQVASMLTVPQDNKGYQKYIYQYNEKGLRIRESCYNKQKELLGKFEYQYTYRK